MNEVWIIDAVRSPRGRGRPGKGALSNVHPQELLAQVLNHLAHRTGIHKEDVDDLVVGCVSQVHEQGACIARHSLLTAGWPEQVTGVTVNRFCGSGAQAVNFGVMGIASGEQSLVVAGGVESMSRVPIGSDGGGIDGNNTVLRTRIAQVPQGISADLIATLEGFSRTDADTFAAESQKRAEQALHADAFQRSLVPIHDPTTQQLLLDKDEHPRAGTTVASLAELKPAFAELGSTKVGPHGETVDAFALKRYPEVTEINHIHTAGNSSGIVDGAAAILLASSDYAKTHGLRPRAKVRATATCGSEPVIMLTAPTPTSQKALARLGMQPKDIDVWEINEAFAVVPLQVMRKLNLDHAKVNIHGGAIALGHPLGATGAMLINTALDILEERDLSTALVTLCIGGGMGVATVIERC